MKNQRLIAVVLVVVLSSILTSSNSAAQRQGFPFPPPDGQDFPPFGPRGGRGGPNAEDIKVVKQCDKNNDGYNEARGSYQLIAKGSRFEVMLKPATRLLARPVLEIANLPAGSALATVEGQLVEKTTRLPSGNLLVEIPLILERPTTVNVAIK